ncbi:Cro/CI family transcriptional regulator [Pectobacterium brasiliense]|uniref:Cro/CI family transcriptional regulator n=1 Tax=Pectobacterium brasiliense TaxID=180957 RepID=UPI000B978A64|nr:Cro/CI family transcriptional regulator [Pectobacterium carotovorum]OYN53226.1 Cro/Cl family transcriptional regulator [Pectobacterium carotovorum]
MKTKDVIEYFGGIKALCRQLELHRSAVYQWGDEVPASRQYELEVKTRGALKSDYTLQQGKIMPREIK